MTEMAMRQQEAVESSKPGAAAKQLALGTLAAIDQNAMTRGFHQKARVVPLRRWGRLLKFQERSDRT